MANKQCNEKKWLCRMWNTLKSPSAVWSLGGILLVGFISGVIFWGGFNTAMEATNTEEFCISCHEMEENVYQEYKQTIHYSNRTGVRATCPDCHVPKEWTHKMIRKIKASNELFHKALGTISTPEKFEAKRLQLAQNVWRSMKATDSRECRNCHDYDSMDFTAQGRRAVDLHSHGLEEGQTCIDCHKGIAHSMPDMRAVDPAIAPGQK
jgi:cytochrome c-type protein NapC